MDGDESANDGRVRLRSDIREPHWCVAEGFGLDGFKCATEIILADNHQVCHLTGAGQIDSFHSKVRSKKSAGVGS
jgi:hypothetical protein